MRVYLWHVHIHACLHILECAMVYMWRSESLFESLFSPTLFEAGSQGFAAELRAPGQMALSSSVSASHLSVEVLGLCVPLFDMDSRFLNLFSKYFYHMSFPLGPSWILFVYSFIFHTY